MSHLRDDLLQRTREALKEWEAARAYATEKKIRYDRLNRELTSRIQKTQEGQKLHDGVDCASSIADASASQPVRPEVS